MDKSLIINEIKSHLNIKTDSDLADFLGVKQPTISTWRKRNSIDYDLIITKCNNINGHWLLTGEGEMLKTPAKAEDPTQQVAEPPTVYNNVTHLEEKIAFLQRENQLLQENKALLEDKVKSLEEKESRRIQELEEEIARLTQENRAIKSQPQDRAVG